MIRALTFTAGPIDIALPEPFPEDSTPPPWMFIEPANGPITVTNVIGGPITLLKGERLDVEWSFELEAWVKL